ncbi:hypothetical protein SH1V18_38770 [Vallitalea longa]|uniref:Uncharacterized protein n=1 Tax=Vallitalea longa TaxID=2936439 RepID=A0A9W6DHB6_9FIRM|nr:hypothetical protein [Vallitalea longa]GKX31397.1 hypothetical protein SH1V18_38770 [Vallitalea longa]
MEKYINNKKLYEFLLSKGIENFFHANTLTTSCSFIQQNKLMSRGIVESLGLPQTSQESDIIDKKYGLWDCIFLDVYDLHKEGFGNYKRQNLYGPILFKLSTKCLIESVPNVRIIKENPVNWEKCNIDTSNAYLKLDEYIENFGDNTFKKMIIFKEENFNLFLDKYLEEVIIDSTSSIKEVNYGKRAYDIILKHMESNNLQCNIKMRECNYDCYCKKNYEEMSSKELQKLFLMKEK